ncbi:unnamed protein product [Closterium sp. NIES-53]
MVISRCCSRYVIKGLPMGYNLMRRMVTLLGMQGDPNHPSYDCPDCKKSDDDQEASRGKTNRSRHRWDNQPRKERQTSKTSSAKDADSLGSNARGDGAASFSMVGVVEPTILMVPEAGEDFQAATLLSADQVKYSSVKLQDDGDEVLLVSAVEDVLDRACYTGRVLYTDLRPCSSKPMVALRTIACATKSTPNIWHARLVHTGIDMIKCTHTFPDKGLEAENVLDVVHIDLCSPLRVAAKDGSLYFPMMKDHKTHPSFVWVRPIAKKSDVLGVFKEWPKVVERQIMKLVKMLRSDYGGEFLGRNFSDFIDHKGILHNVTYPYTPQQNGMAGTGDAHGRRSRADDAVSHGREALLVAPRPLPSRLGAQQPRTGFAALSCLRCLRTTPHELLFAKNSDLTVAHIGLAASMVAFPPPLIPSMPKSASTSATGDEGSIGASPLAPACGNDGGRRDVVGVEQVGD